MQKRLRLKVYKRALKRARFLSLFLFCFTLLVVLPSKYTMAQTTSVNGARIPGVPSITDSGGNLWTVKKGIIYENGEPAGYSASVIQLDYLNGTIYQKNSYNNWYSWTGSTWINATSPLVVSINGASIPPAPLIIRSNLRVFVLSNSTVYRDGVSINNPTPAQELLYLKNDIYEEDTSKNWWRWDDNMWRATSNPGQPINGQVGSDEGQNFVSLLSTDPNLCAAGTVINFVTTQTGWTWGCQGSNGGTTDNSGMAYLVINGKVGSAEGQNFAALSASSPGLCAAGTVINFITTQTGWTWGCQGSNGGTTDNSGIAYLIMNGMCGSANGVPTNTAPTTGLCNAGNATTVIGTAPGPWSWSCVSSDGGTTANCSAPAGGGNQVGLCGPTNETTLTVAPTAGLCSSNSTASAVGGTGPWYWNCSNSSGTSLCEANTFSGYVVPFTPLHTYYLAPNGNDSNSGTSPSQPWQTPNHAVQCGDVIVAAAGNYGGNPNFSEGASPFAIGAWGTVSNCPSTSGGIDGNGGIYFATLLCAGPELTSCSVTNTWPYNQEAFRVTQSNWAIEGFSATGPVNSGSSCFAATVDNANSGVIHHVAFINDIGTNCGTGSFGSNGYLANTGVDQTAVVGAIAYNSASASGVCGSGISLIPANGPDESAGTHVFVAGAFSYDNINGFCGNRSNGSGSYTTATAAAAPGATSIIVASVSNWVVDFPIGDLGNSAYNWTNPALPKGTYITSITGNGPYTIGLSQAVAAPGVQAGDNIAAMTTTDGEGIIFDTWKNYSYTGVAEQNVLWGNGSAGYEMFCNGTCQASLQVDVFSNSMYGNVQDPKHQGVGAEFVPSQLPNNFFATNNLAQANITAVPGVYNQQAATAWPVVAGTFGQSGTGIAISGNYFASAPNATCPLWATCNVSNDIANYNGVNFDSNAGAPGFKNPLALPYAAPNCTSQMSTTDCMIASGVIDAITPTGAAAGHGYQPPHPCAVDAYYPSWLKGVVYLNWNNGLGLTESPGLVTKPCGM